VILSTCYTEKQKTKDWRPRLSELQRVVRIRNLFKGIQGKFTVQEIWIGGGGNTGLDCLQMCQDQLELMENEDKEAMELAWAEEQLWE
jgi:hypothetical protein